jgi:Flp pilus assembly protein TadD
VTETDDSMVDRAALLIDLHRAGEAVDLLHRVVAAAPESQRAWCELARAELSRGCPDAAVRAVDRALALGPQEEWPHRLASIALGRLGSPEEALRAARAAVRLAPYTWQGQVRLAEALDRHPWAGWPGQPMREEAWRAACQAVELAPLEPDPHSTVGHLLLRGAEPGRAESAFREALRLDPTNARALNGLGLANLRRGRLITAAADFGAAAAADPHEDVARRNISAAAWNATQYLLVGLLADLLIVVVSTDTLRSPVAGRIGAVTAAAWLVGPGVVAWRRVPRRMRGYLVRLPRQDRWLGGTLAASVLTLVLFLGVMLAPATSPRGPFAGLGLLGILVAGGLRVGGMRRHNRAVGRLDGTVG